MQSISIEAKTRIIQRIGTAATSAVEEELQAAGFSEARPALLFAMLFDTFIYTVNSMGAAYGKRELVAETLLQFAGLLQKKAKSAAASFVTDN